MSKEIEFEVRLPKGVRLKDINKGTIAIDDRWMTTVREGHRNIEILPYGRAKRKYG